MTDATTDLQHQQMVSQSGNSKLAFWFFLGSEITLFASLIATFALFRLHYAPDYAAFKEHLNIPLVGFNTLVLIISSYMVVRALKAIKRGNQRGLMFNLLVALALGILFIGGQAYEWSTLFGEGVTLKSTFGSPFYVVTGIHGSHVLIGVAWAAFTLVNAMTGTYSAENYDGIENFGLYWHFVDIVWIILFSFIYLF